MRFWWANAAAAAAAALVPPCQLQLDQFILPLCGRSALFEPLRGRGGGTMARPAQGQTKACALISQLGPWCWCWCCCWLWWPVAAGGDVQIGAKFSRHRGRARETSGGHREKERAHNLCPPLPLSSAEGVLKALTSSTRACEPSRGAQGMAQNCHRLRTEAGAGAPRCVHTASRLHREQAEGAGAQDQQRALRIHMTEANTSVSHRMCDV